MSFHSLYLLGCAWVFGLLCGYLAVIVLSRSLARLILLGDVEPLEATPEADKSEPEKPGEGLPENVLDARERLLPRGRP